MSAQPTIEAVAPRLRGVLDRRAAIGLVALATDRIGPDDFRAFLRPASGVGVYETRTLFSGAVEPAALAR